MKKEKRKRINNMEPMVYIDYKFITGHVKGKEEKAKEEKKAK